MVFEDFWSPFNKILAGFVATVAAFLAAAVLLPNGHPLQGALFVAVVVYLVWLSALITVFSDWLLKIEGPYLERRMDRWSAKTHRKARAKRPPLAETLGMAASANVSERRQAAKVLGALDEDEVPEGEKAALVRSLLALSDDPDPATGAQGLKALGSQWNLVENDTVPRVLRHLLKHLDDADARRRHAAAEAIVWFDLPEDAALRAELLPGILALSHSDDPALRRNAMQLLLASFDSASPLFAEAALSEARTLVAGRDGETRFYAAALLCDEAADAAPGAQGPLVAALLPLSRDGNPLVRGLVAELLDGGARATGAEGLAACLDALIRLADDRDVDVRPPAIHALLAFRKDVPPDLRPKVDRILAKYHAK